MGRIRKCEPCGCSDWRSKLNEIWNRCQEMITGIHFNGTTYGPDGTGLVDLGDLSPGADITDNTTYYTLTIYDADMVSLNDRATYWEITVS